MSRSITGIIDSMVNGDTNDFHSLASTSILKGMGLVSIFAWVQSHYGEDEWSQILNPPHTWHYFEEWNNLRRIRHCFAHSYHGNLLETQSNHIIDFHTRLVNGEIKNEDDTVTESYYKIIGNRIVLETYATRRARMLCVLFLKEYEPNN